MFKFLYVGLGGALGAILRYSFYFYQFHIIRQFLLIYWEQ